MAGLIVLASGPAGAHEGELHWETLSTWTFDPWLTVPFLISGGCFALGVARLWRRAGVNRGVRAWQVGSFAAGWLVLGMALVSPLHWLGERLFTAHMVEHEALMAIAAPLLVLARPLSAMAWGLPRRWRPVIGAIGQAPVPASLWAWLTLPFIATIVHGLALWAWHVPFLYETALASTAIHRLQHLCFFFTAILFWWALLRGRERERGYGAAVVYLFATAAHSGFLGILLSLARSPLYPAQTSQAPLWGLSALEDQQIAGLIMWIPAGLVYAGAAIALAGFWIAHSAHLGRKRGYVTQ
jgi:cytochrome c oxidase assembly factor CtaG